MSKEPLLFYKLKTCITMFTLSLMMKLNSLGYITFKGFLKIRLFELGSYTTKRNISSQHRPGSS